MSVIEDQSELLRDFAEEALSTLRTLPAHLDDYRRAPSAEPINAVFRGVHSLKGNAGFFGLPAVKAFAHAVENTLDEIRGKGSPIRAELQRALIASFDRLEEMVTAAAGGVSREEMTSDDRALLDDVSRHSAVGALQPDRRQELHRTLLALAETDVPGIDTPIDWLEAVVDAKLDEVVRRLTEDKTDSETKKSTTETPAPTEFAGAAWNCPPLDLAEHMGDILQLFLAFDQGEYDGATGPAFVAAAEKLAAKAAKAGLVSLSEALQAAVGNFHLVTSGPIPLDGLLLSVVWDSLWPELSKLIVVEAAETPLAATSNPLPQALAATQREVAAKPGSAKAGRLVRVKEERLDDFLDQVARLFITGEMFKDLQGRMAETRQMKPMVEELREIIRSFSELTQVLQKGLFSLRRVPTANLFAKFPGMARGLARQLGKEVEVQLIGEEIEIDKALIEDLDAPLTHIIRNAVDHGVDSPEARRARGVSDCGTVTLKAELTRTHVRITIVDDGRGIDPNKLRNKALEKGLYSAAELAAMADDDALQLIFHPGFSTAEKLSDVSGRGVGLDVVRSAVRKHRGEVYVQSQVNVGTTFRLELPLREAVLVIDGLMIRHAGEEFVIPFEFIREITQLNPSQLTPLHGAQAAVIRETVYDARRLGALLDVDDPVDAVNKQMSAVVVGTQHGRFCLLVDQVLGTRKVVVNGLKDIVSGSNSIAGVTQLGGGRLALVLNVPEMLGALVDAAACETLQRVVTR